MAIGEVLMDESGHTTSPGLTSPSSWAAEGHVKSVQGWVRQLPTVEPSNSYA